MVFYPNQFNVMDKPDFAFTSDRTEILSALTKSKSLGTVVGISAPVAGSGLLLTAVEDIHPVEDDFVITLKGYDVSGYILERTRIRLNEIRAVCSFNSVFRNPYLKEVEGEQFYKT